MDYIISRRLSSDRLYAYFKNRFWIWDDSQCAWKESHLMSQKYEREHDSKATLTPEQFMTDLTKFQQLDEFELDSTMLDALKDAKPCKAAPIEPVKEEKRASEPYIQHCDYSKSHKCENIAGLRHFIKHGEIQGCAGCCPICKKEATCEYACAYVKPTGERPTLSAQCLDAVTAADDQTAASLAVPETSSPMTEPVTAAATPVVPASASENVPVPSSTAPTFDFSALGDLSAQAVEADRQFDIHYGTAQDEYLISCIYVAQMHALTAKAGRYGGGTWTKWYQSKGLGEGSVRRMIQNGEAFKSANMADLKCLPELTRKDLNLIARSGCAEQLTEAAGDSKRVQELLAQLKLSDKRADDLQAHNDKLTRDYNDEFVKRRQAEKRADTAENDYRAALADVNGLTEQNAQLQQSYNEANEARMAARLQCQKAEGERDKAEARARNAEDALKKQPITGVVDEEEVDRRAHQQAYSIAADMTAELKADKENLENQLKAVNRQLSQMRSQFNDSVQADFENANNIPIQLWSAWNSGKGSYSRLSGEDLESTFLTICTALDGIKKEVAQLCRQPADYKEG